MKICNIFALILSLMLLSSCASAEDDCPYFPEFSELRSEMQSMNPTERATALQQYSKKYDNPESCESFKVNELLDKYEKPLIYLLDGKVRKQAQVLFRCDKFDEKTATCKSPMMDNTAQRHLYKIKPLHIMNASVSIKSDMSNLRLIGIYIIKNSELLDGGTAEKVKQEKNTIKLNTSKKDYALIAIYKTDDAWNYRKAVWYF